MVRAVVAGVLVALSARDAGAQITTYVAPPRPVTPSRLAVAADSARRDSVDKLAMTNMKAWVDSAAGVSIPAHVGDSTAPAPVPAPVPAPIPEPAPAPLAREPVPTTFENGLVAPATASNLPVISLLGVLGMAFGAVLLTRRHRG